MELAHFHIFRLQVANKNFYNSNNNNNNKKKKNLQTTRCLFQQLKDLVEVVVRELVSTQHSISDDELLRAKTQLQSMLLMNLESRPIVFEDVGRQVLANGHRRTPHYYYDMIG